MFIVFRFVILSLDINNFPIFKNTYKHNCSLDKLAYTTSQKTNQNKMYLNLS